MLCFISIALLTKACSLLAQYTLRILVENSTKMFVNLVETPCQCCLAVDDDFEWGTDFINSDFRPHVQPIFTLHLKMDDTGAFYSTEPDLFAVSLEKGKLHINTRVGFYYVFMFWYNTKSINDKTKP